MVFSRPALLVALVSLPVSAMAQTAASTASVDRRSLGEEAEAALTKKIADEIRESLREELKAEIKAELAAEAAMSGGVAEDSWSENEWKWEEPAKPSIDFLEFDGFFRFRYDFFHKLDLGTYFLNPATGQASGPFSPTFSPPTPICNTDINCSANREAATSLGSANMRFRVEPTFNVYEDIKIKMQIDVLDNIVLGSNPDGFPLNDTVPLLGFSQTQLPPSDTVNALTDSVRVKRVWAEVMTPLGQLRVGRMPSHWGMGLLANGGRGIDSDFGDSNDRIMFATKIAGHYVVPAFDWTVSGPTSAFRGQPQGQPFDRSQRDDVDQYILAVAKRDKDEEIKERLENDEVVINYGVYGVYREQSFSAGQFFTNGDPNANNTTDLVPRGLNAWIYSMWFKLLYRKFDIEAEHVGIIGNVDSIAKSGTFNTRDKKVDITQFGAAVRGRYRFLNDALSVELLTVFASGDSAPGWGIQPLATSPQAGQWDGGQDEDGKINNFRVDPDFHVDLILWRQLVGTVTDALIFKPGVQYNFTKGLGARLDLIYSRSMFAQSTPSAGLDPTRDYDRDTAGAADGRSPSSNLGLEGDVRVFYRSDDGFNAWLEYGLFIPFDGLDRAVIPGTNPNEQQFLNASIAQTIQAMLAVTF